MVLRIGVVGYSGQKFNANGATKILAKALDDIASETNEEISLVSGLTDVGIPAIAYRLAAQRGWSTVGVACSKAMEFAVFPVDSSLIVGTEWGDESETFLNMIDVLVRVGGGNQSKAETAAAKKRGIPVIEFDLEAIA